MLAGEKDRLRKITGSGEGTVSVDRCTEDWVVPLSWCNQIWQSQREGARKPGVESGSEHDSNGLNADLGH